MNEADAYELFVLIAEMQNQLLFGYFGVVTAFLVMSYLVAEKLDTFLAWIAVILYSICCAWFFFGLWGWTTDLTNLYADLIKNKNEGVYQLNWFGANPKWLAAFVNFLELIVTFGGWMVSLVYFFYRRGGIGKHDGKNA